MKLIAEYNIQDLVNLAKNHFSNKSGYEDISEFKCEIKIFDNDKKLFVSEESIDIKITVQNKD